MAAARREKRSSKTSDASGPVEGRGRHRLRRLGCGSLVRGPLPEGCVRCMEGGKLVLFITGECSFRCFYCPISSEKFGFDFSFANERPVHRFEDVLEEARVMRANGTGITGGDPLDKMERTLDWIRRLKEEFGADHHIHLYTATRLSPSQASSLAQAGLDELRIHVPVEWWARKDDYIECLRGLEGIEMDIGVEMPAVPGRLAALEALLLALPSPPVKFVNLNELEFSETNYDRMSVREHITKDDETHAAAESLETARAMLAKPWPFTLHFCTSVYKDAGQLRRRMLRRAEGVMSDFQLLTEDGTLLFGVIEGLRPEIEDALSNLNVPRKEWEWEESKGRMAVSPGRLEEIASRLPFPKFIVEEYPTWDRLEVERAPL